MSQQPVVEEPLVGEVRFRVPLPIVIPFGALAVIALFTIVFSRVLLSIPHEAATIVAIAIAANILGGCAFIALRPRAGAATLIELAAVVLYPLIIGVAVAALNIGEAEAPRGPAAEAPAAAGTTLVAVNVAFDTTSLELKGPSVELTFDNQDALVHNFAIYKNADDGPLKKNPLFTGEEIAAGSSKVYDIDLPPPGRYYFQCDIHPSMNGDLTVK
ncbi:MAG: cupredoxin domain-containing protein [Actinobacteria bacterium]|nr:cupredoxin domain-containing protein [Actinomycetota bacterium]